MADEITKEGEDAVRIKDTEGKIVKLSELKETLGSLEKFIQEQSALHQKRMDGLNVERTLLLDRIAAAEGLGVKEKEKEKAKG